MEMDIQTFYTEETAENERILNENGDGDYASESEDYHTIHRVLAGMADMLAVISEFNTIQNKINECSKQATTTEAQLGLLSTKIANTDPEDKSKFLFTPIQIAMVIEKFLLVGTQSLIDLSKFEFVIEDITIISRLGLKDFKGKDDFLPKMWLKLDKNQISYLASRLKNQRNCVNWRSFVLDCMEIPCPSQPELLCALQQFRMLDPKSTYCVDKNKYDLVTLWFEPINRTEIAADCNPFILRECIFEMFCDQDRLFPFIDFLFHFCKDFDPNRGFAKILALLTDRIVSTAELPDFYRPRSPGEIKFTDSDVEFLLEEEEIPQELVYGHEELGENLEEDEDEVYWQPIPLSKRLIQIHRQRHETISRTTVQVPSRFSYTEETTQNEIYDEETGEEEEEAEVEILGRFSKQKIAEFEEAVKESAKYELDELKYESNKNIGENEVEDEGEDFEEEDVHKKQQDNSPSTQEIHKTDETGKEVEEERKDEPQNKRRTSKKKGQGHKKGQEAGRKSSPPPAPPPSARAPKSKKPKKAVPGGRKSQTALAEIPKQTIAESNEESEEKQDINIIMAADEQIEEGEESEAENEDTTENVILTPKLIIKVEIPELVYISAQAFIQAIWFGHKTAFPRQNLTESQISRELGKLKNLVVEVFQEVNQKSKDRANPSDVLSAKLSSILRHPFIREMLKRYTSFKRQDIPQIVKDALKIPTIDAKKSVSSISFASSIEESQAETEAEAEIHQKSALSSIVSDISYQNSFTDLIKAISLENLQKLTDSKEVTSGDKSQQQEKVATEGNSAVSVTSNTNTNVTAKVSATSSFSSIRNDSLRGMYVRLSRQSKLGRSDSRISFGDFDDVDFWGFEIEEEEERNAEELEKVPSAISVTGDTTNNINNESQLELRTQSLEFELTKPPSYFEESPTCYYSYETEGEGESYNCYRYQKMSIPRTSHNLLRLSEERQQHQQKAQILTEDDGVLEFYQNLKNNKPIIDSRNKFNLQNIQNLKLSTEFGLDPKLRSFLWQ